MPVVVSYFFGAFVSLFSIVNPLMAAPAFFTLTETNTPAERKAIAKRASWSVFGILLAFLVAGSLILGFFGISIHALRVAGGLMILSSAYGMLNKRERLAPEEELEAQEKEDIAFSPLAMPLLSGPGSIAVLIGLTADASDSKIDIWQHYLAILVAIMLVSLACYFTLRLSETMVPRLGKTLVKAFSRMMGFILLCVGVQYIVNGVEGAVFQSIEHWPAK